MAKILSDKKRIMMPDFNTVKAVVIKICYSGINIGK